ncbi:MAG TPA: hypothetical protein VD978_03200 [Azospirillum sp.]|nr:hypothetical protein [Azospirillum sp.]
MYPLLTFASGLIAGAVGLRLLKSVQAPKDLKAATLSGIGTVGAKAQSGVDLAQTAVREAAVSGLSAIEKTSAHLRSKLTTAPEEPPSEHTPPAIKKVKTPRTRRAAVKTAAGETTPAVRTSPRRSRKAKAAASAGGDDA